MSARSIQLYFHYELFSIVQHYYQHLRVDGSRQSTLKSFLSFLRAAKFREGFVLLRHTNTIWGLHQTNGKIETKIKPGQSMSIFVFILGCGNGTNESIGRSGFCRTVCQSISVGEKRAKKNIWGYIQWCNPYLATKYRFLLVHSWEIILYFLMI